MIHHPPGVGRFQFVVLATLRATQLLRGCRPRVDGAHKATVIAQIEVSEGKVIQLFTEPVTSEEPAPTDSAATEAVSASVPAI